MRRTRSQLSIAAVALVLGILVVVQLRATAGSSGLAALSSQDLTVLVANLNARNDQLRREASSLEAELSKLTANQSRGDDSLLEIAADLKRVRAYAGLDAVGGPGVSISIRGPIDGPGVEELINELRNAGAEAIVVDGVRIVTGVVVTGPAGQAQVEGVGLSDAFDLGAIGAPDKLTGSLTRSGGVIAQLAATQPDVVVTVTPVERLEMPATTRTSCRSMVSHAFDTLTRRCQSIPSSRSPWAMSFACAAPIPAAGRPGRSIASARISGCAARRVPAASW